MVDKGLIPPIWRTATQPCACSSCDMLIRQIIKRNKYRYDFIKVQVELLSKILTNEKYTGIEPGSYFIVKKTTLKVVDNNSKPWEEAREWANLA